MKHSCRLNRALASGVFLCLMVAFWAVAAVAGGGPSAETCTELGKIDYRCMDCATGAYIGTVTEDALYDASFNSCAGKFREARNLCARAYGRERATIGLKWEYWIGGTKDFSTWPKNCTY